jgi:DNA-binding NtrC family response regulator
VNITQKRLLFVDDEEAIRITLAAILRGYGYTVTLAATVTHAIKEIKTQEFDLLLSDLNIDGLRNGFEVIRAMQEINPNCVKIILTGHPDLESEEQGVHLGVGEYIAKPAGVGMLMALLEEKLAARKYSEHRGKRRQGAKQLKP